MHEGERIPYAIHRSNRRTVALIVAADGTVRVRAPRHVPERSVVGFVEARASWVAAKRAAAQQRTVSAPRYVTGERHAYLGRELTLAVETGVRTVVSIREARLVASVAGEPTPDRVRRALDVWYRAEARRVLPERLERCWSVFSQPGEVMPELRVRLMRSRWGSLTPANRVSLNAHLMRLPEECIDYVIFHELCHLRVRNHSPAFYREVERYVPDWRDLRRRLRLAGHAD